MPVIPVQQGGGQERIIGKHFPFQGPTFVHNMPKLGYLVRKYTGNPAANRSGS
jgi:hypothetical protein